MFVYLQNNIKLIFSSSFNKKEEIRKKAIIPRKMKLGQCICNLYIVVVLVIHMLNNSEVVAEVYWSAELVYSYGRRVPGEFSRYPCAFRFESGPPRLRFAHWPEFGDVGIRLRVFSQPQSAILAHPVTSRK